MIHLLVPKDLSGCAEITRPRAALSTSVSVTDTAFTRPHRLGVNVKDRRGATVAAKDSVYWLVIDSAPTEPDNGAWSPRDPATFPPALHGQGPRSLPCPAHKWLSGECTYWLLTWHGY